MFTSQLVIVIKATSSSSGGLGEVLTIVECSAT